MDSTGVQYVDHSFGKLLDRTIEHKGEFKEVLVCALCKNLWQLPNNRENDALNHKPSYYSCSKCNIKVHSSCRLMMKLCRMSCCVGDGDGDGDGTQHGHTTINIQIGSEAVPWKMLSVPSTSLTGNLYIRILRAYDLNVTEGKVLYGIIKKDNESLITDNANSGLNECIWNLVEPDSKSDLFFNVEVNPTRKYDVSSERNGYPGNFCD